jgi:hypothetical protein
MKYLNRKISIMAGKPIPNPSILDRCKVVGVEGQRKVYYDSQEDRYYTWDSLHGELEVFNKRGRHLGVVCPITGDLIKPAVKGRRISKQN